MADTNTFSLKISDYNISCHSVYLKSLFFESDEEYNSRISTIPLMNIGNVKLQKELYSSELELFRGHLETNKWFEGSDEVEVVQESFLKIDKVNARKLYIYGEEHPVLSQFKVVDNKVHLDKTKIIFDNHTYVFSGIENKEFNTTALFAIQGNATAQYRLDDGIDTGFSLNGMLNGLQHGDLIIIATRPSVGKTALSLNLAKNCCKTGGMVDFFSLEMPGKQLMKRMLSDITYVDGAKWKNSYSYFSDDDYDRGVLAIGTLDEWNLRIHDEPRQTIAEIRSAIQKTKREHPNEGHLVIIDYLQLITQSKTFERQDLAVGHMTRELKQIARQYEVPNVLLSQLSTQYEHKAMSAIPHYI